MISVEQRVSIHASAREATHDPRCPIALAASFNPRLRAGGDLSMYSSSVGSNCFNPRLRAGGDKDSTDGCTDPMLVSIHASAREATDDGADGQRLTDVSIHASAREATSGCRCPRMRQTLFQSTPPARRRPLNSLERLGSRVSIHASAREATSPEGPRPSIWSRFQSTPPRGEATRGPVAPRFFS